MNRNKLLAKELRSMGKSEDSAMGITIHIDMSRLAQMMRKPEEKEEAEQKDEYIKVSGVTPSVSG